MFQGRFRRGSSRGPGRLAGLISAGLLLAAGLTGSAAADGPRALSLTIYNRDLGLVRDVRTLPIAAGEGARAIVPDLVDDRLVFVGMHGSSYQQQEEANEPGRHAAPVGNGKVGPIAETAMEQFKRYTESFKE